MNIINLDDFTKQSDFSIAILNEDTTTYITIQEGSGDNLTQDDVDDGYIDYINYTKYSINDGVISEVDGGMVLLTTYYTELSLENIIEIALDEADVSKDSAIICLPYEATTEFYEDATGVDMNKFDTSEHDDEMLDTFNKILACVEEYSNEMLDEPLDLTGDSLKR